MPHKPPADSRRRAHIRLRTLSILIGCLALCTHAYATDASGPAWLLNLLVGCVPAFLTITLAVARFAYVLWKGRPYATGFIDWCVWVAAHLSLVPWYFALWLIPGLSGRA